MREILPDLILVSFWALLGIIGILGWLAPDGCSAANVLFNPESCETAR
jgi:hypothetical protein